MKHLVRRTCSSFTTLFVVVSVFFSLVFTSCEKMVIDEDSDEIISSSDADEVQPENTIALHIAPYVSDADQCSWKVTRATKDASEDCKFLYAIVFDKDGVVESASSFDQTHMNAITLYLERGHNHRVALLASNSAAKMDGSGNLSFDKLSRKTYYAVKDFRIASSKTEDINDVVTLVPAVASIKLVTEVYSRPVDMTVNLSLRSTKFNMYTGQGMDASESTIQALKYSFTEGKNYLMIQTFIDEEKMSPFDGDVSNLPEAADGYFLAGTMTSTCKDSETGEAIGSMKCDQLPIAKHHETTITGNVFTNAASLSIQIDDTWVAGPVIHF